MIHGTIQTNHLLDMLPMSNNFCGLVQTCVVGSTQTQYITHSKFMGEHVNLLPELPYLHTSCCEQWVQEFLSPDTINNLAIILLDHQHCMGIIYSSHISLKRDSLYIATTKHLGLCLCLLVR